MESNSLLFLPSDKFYLPMEFYNFDHEFLNIIKKGIKDNEWYVGRDRIFISCSPLYYEFPEFGWKIHISATLWNCKEILEIVTSYCYANNIAFKCLMDQTILEHMQDKNVNRSNSGKFITIYPPNDNSFFILIKDLYRLLVNFEGPHILTDRKYGKKGVVYYRFGGIRPTGNDNVLMGPNGEKFIDDRSPIYKIPTWIKDPFYNSPETPSPDNILLNNRYKIIKALRFTNAGGTYLALDNFSGDEVIVKEARPLTLQHGSNLDSVKMKENEYELLLEIDTKLKSSFTPKPIEIFKEWEHTFLVVSFVEGKTIKEYFDVINYFVLPNKSNKDFKTFLNKIITVTFNIIDRLNLLHKAGILVSDMSNENIIIDESLDPYFIDFDSAIKKENENKVSVFGTPGFFDPEEGRQDIVDGYKRDFKGVGYLAFSMLTPSFNLSILRKSFIKDHLEYLEYKYNLPKLFSNLILNLINQGDASNLNRDKLYKSLDNIDVEKKNICRYALDELILDEKISKLNNFVSASKLDSNSIMFPSNFMAKNYIGIESGGAGVLSAIKDTCFPKKDIEALTDFLQRSIYEESNELTDDLLNGTTGVLWSLIDSSHDEQNYSDLLDLINRRILNNKDTENIYLSLSEGVSGIGIFYIRLYIITNKDNYKEIAIKIGNTIVEKSSYIASTNYQGIGLNSGGSGVALFLYYLYKLTKNEEFLHTGLNLVKEDLKYYKDFNGGLLFPETKDSKDNIYYPYLGMGTAGITAVVIRFLKETQDSYLNKYLPKLLDGMDAKFSVNIGVLSGLSGITNVYYDAYLFLGIDNLRRKTFCLLENISSLLIDKDENKLACPGDLMYRYSCEYSYGASGVIELFARIQDQKKDYYIFIDELIQKHLNYSN